MEKTLSIERVFTGKLLKVDRVKVELEDGEFAFREVVNFPEVAVVLAFDKDDRIMVVKQYRKPVESHLIEAIAGKVDHGETPADAARRELKEETGYDCLSLKKVGVVYPTPGYCTEMQHYFVATVQGMPGEQSGDDDEKIEVIWMTADEVVELVKEGKPLDGKLMTALALSAIDDNKGVE